MKLGNKERIALCWVDYLLEVGGTTSVAQQECSQFTEV